MGWCRDGLIGARIVLLMVLRRQTAQGIKCPMNGDIKRRMGFVAKQCTQTIIVHASRGAPKVTNFPGFAEERNKWAQQTNHRPWKGFDWNIGISDRAFDRSDHLCTVVVPMSLQVKLREGS